MKLVRGCIIFIIWLPFKLLSLGRKTVNSYIEPSMFEGKPILYCSFGNSEGRESITITEFQLIVDGQSSTMPFRNNGMSLPRTVEINNGFVYSVDPIPLVTKARETVQKKFEVRAFFRDSVGRTYLSKSLKLNTDEKRFIRKFEMAHKPLPEPLNTLVHLVSIPFFYLLILIFPDFEI